MLEKLKYYKFEIMILFLIEVLFLPMCVQLCRELYDQRIRELEVSEKIVLYEYGKTYLNYNEYLLDRINEGGSYD